MTPTDARRLAVITALITSLIVTLGVRLVWVQVLDENKPVQTAGITHEGTIVVPAPRGLIVDARGRVMVGNKSTQVVTVDRDALLKMPDDGAAVIARLAKLLGTTPSDLNQEITPCGVNVPSPCWTGEPFQPVPVATNPTPQVMLAIAERGEEYPGVKITTQTVRDYFNGAMAAHLFGYVGAVNEDDQKNNPKLHDADTIGRTGLEEQYDAILRGINGGTVVNLDPRGEVVDIAREVAPRQGDTLVTSIDMDVQKRAEASLKQEIEAQRKAGKGAKSGALVVMDPNTGRIIAAASYPSYDPQLFVGGISVKDYAKLTAPGANDPLVGRAVSGAYAPGSTFKLISSSNAVMHGQANFESMYPCPGSIQIDGRTKTNYDSGSLGTINLAKILGYSCDTIFYSWAAEEYYADQRRIEAGQKPLHNLQNMAKAFGVGSEPGLDLPIDEQAKGSYADRETRMARWERNKKNYCDEAARGYPEETDPGHRAFLTLLAKENCTDGWRYRAGDNADMGIGQGETTMSPLQLAVAYSALLNGGTVWKPTIGWAVIDPSGKTVRTIQPQAKNKVPVSQAALNYIAKSLNFENDYSVSGAGAFSGAKYQTLIGGKTGTAEVQGNDDTSWIATWGPTSYDASGKPKADFVIVGMIEQGGLGARAAGPMVRRVYDGILGDNKGVATPPILPGSKVSTAVPKLAPLVRVSGR